ncbi:MAG: hypothetical protein II996_04595 [Oscillospiraceae bacterium]|nr:hypothetical protein [Oscillospiraceae bacterium]
MKRYGIKMVGDSFCWQDIPVLEMECYYHNTPDSIKAYAQICSSEDSLNVHLWTTEPSRREEEKDLLGSPCRDSCLEFFFSPMEDDKRYFNIEFNSNGCLFLGFGTCMEDLTRLISSDFVAERIIIPQIDKKDGGWDLFYSIPFEFIRRFFPDFKPYEGKNMKANCYKCSGRGEYPHYISWNPIEGLPFSYHRTECFGTMTFVK